MKPLKISLAALALLFAGVTANAVENPNSDKPTKDEVVSTYISAITTGNIKALDKILESDMQFNAKHGDNVSTINKDQLLDGMKNSISNAPVNTSVTVMADDDDSEKVKIVFNYDGYVRTDIVNLDHNFGWKINTVTSSNK